MLLDTQEGDSHGATDLDVRPEPSERPLLATDAEPEEAQESPPAASEGLAQPQEETGTAPEPGMAEALAVENDTEGPQRGEIRQGTVVSIRPTEIVIDIGVKRECVVPASDLQKLGGQAAEAHEGDQVSVYIVKPGGREGPLVGSLHLAAVEADWARAEDLQGSGGIFEAKVSGQNRGGLLVPFGRLRGFVPASHLIAASPESEGRALSLGHWVGKTLPFKVIEVNRRRNRLIFSYRAARRQWRSQQKESLLGELHEGEVRRGIVSSVASFGAFVDLGGADGLIHVSEMAWYRVEHPSEIVQVGQEVEAYILRVDPTRGRIGLSLKRLQPDPWTLVEDKYHPGDLIEGKVTKLVDFGAFVELEKGIEGLIHFTELADPVPARPEEVVQPGEVHLLRVLRADAQSRRIGLSLKAVTREEREAWEAQHARAPAPSQPTGADEGSSSEDASELPQE